MTDPQLAPVDETMASLRARAEAAEADRNQWIRKARTAESARRRDRLAREPFMRELARFMVDELRTAKFIEITERAISEPDEP